MSFATTLIDLSSKTNDIHPTFAKNLGFVLQKTDVGAQKVDDIILRIFGIVIVVFSIYDKAKKICLFEKTFLLDDISIDITLKKLFFTLSNANVYFIY